MRKKTLGHQPAKPQKSFLREWFNSLLFAVIAATLIRFLTFEAYAIPTPSMENSLMVGDFLFVSKLHYGIRTPRTPLQIPLTHQSIWGTKIPSYSDLIQLPSFRLPGFTTVKNGDVVVFNFPPPKPGEPDHPVDLRTNLIKRCIGIPGDRLEIRQEKVYINGKAFPAPARSQTSYFIRTSEVLNERFFRKYNIVNDYNSAEGPFINWQPVEQYDEAAKTSALVGYQVTTTAETIARIRALDWVKAVEPLTEPAGQPEPGIYGGATHEWNRDNFGPLTIPKEGQTIPINPQTIAVYGPVISRYDGNEKVEITPNSIKIDGKPIQSYTFKQDYYFMMGDNRHNSDDSRYWGFVPKDHIVGKAVFVWMSIDPTPATAWAKIRWNRLFRVIE
ncbi:signal peptidase I [Larkinella arboricola]|uniref:Signal peptidase I n=1 Tax=Larkinella arboricola TaxID=643671 RepID=A0A327X976_LARAB|nr:signal peptidase I [Larkinella arboricola]RAK02808.1 signal peptidase I [Larkinella arboricola]